MKAPPDYINKRFTGLVFMSALLTFGLFFGQAEVYPIFAGTLGTIYSVFAASQGFTDAKEGIHVGTAKD